ncbi:MAG: exodeoxyribonuclease V subunit beta [Aquabacterium sp.]|uniref:exodeoxyribonuclease V subunit beta n=1 Tax=Aquabacterium sp. TaxID=1872578 RepID=UPI003BCE457A
MSQPLHPLSFPLWGSRLIEASAGTGKTWTIAALYVRLVLGHGGSDGFSRPLLPADILVMTFTRAATRELSDRIRARLIEAARCFRGEPQVGGYDSMLQALLAAYPDESQRSQAAWRLSLAAEGMDEASVHTIDAWCQRMLREHAFDSGCLFEETLEPDAQTLLVEAAQDYWRQHCYPLSEAQLTEVLKIWSGVDELVSDVSRLHEQVVGEDIGGGPLSDVVATQQALRARHLADVKAGWVARADAMLLWLDEQTAPKVCDWDRRKLSSANYRGWLATLRAWAEQADLEVLDLTEAACHRLTPEGLMEAFKGDLGSLRLPEDFDAFERLLADLDTLPKISVPVRLHAAACVGRRLAQLKQQAGTFGFADMLHRLDAALSGPHGHRLRDRVLAQYPVALLDEFQDTSPLQYRIFDQIYRTETNDAASALLLIGDPKQSIYGFRGADIHSYMAARQATEGRHYVLDTNFRSTNSLVAAVNAWFVQAEQREGRGAFLFREPGQASSVLPFESVKAKGRAEVLAHGETAMPAITVVHGLHTVQSAKSWLRPYAAMCAEQIVQWLNDEAFGFVEQGVMQRRLRPADIAVLVRDRNEAEAVRRQLTRRGVASVYLSDKDSVFWSDEARDLLFWLRAVASPMDVRLARAALATRMVGLSLDELGWLAANDEAFDARSETLRELHAVWQNQGVLTMLRHTLHKLDLPARWLAETGGERKLTNYLHLAELLQNASTQLDGEQALVRWLVAQMEEGGASGEEQVVRLESDADLVKVVTVHKSKGLEYPVVCLPFAASFKQIDPARTTFVNLLDEQGIRRLVLDLSDPVVRELADRDRLREDLRLFYVALTRARHHMWLGLPALGKSGSEVCSNHLSASGYLLAGAEQVSPAALLANLQALTQEHAEMALQALPDEVGQTLLLRENEPLPLGAPCAYDAAFDRRWTIASFSALVRALGQLQVSPATVGTVRPADDEWPAEAGDEGVASPERAASVVEGGAPPAWHRFTKGAVAGNFLHDQLEWLSAERFDLARPDTQERLRKQCERAGRLEQFDDVRCWLQQVVSTPLGGVGASLQSLSHVLPEMEFWLPAQRLSAQEIDGLCQAHLLHGRARPDLPERELHGMLMGFADLVFEHEGRYWVLDYKSNHLGDSGAAYTHAAMEEAMAVHRYDVQAAIYLLALHRLLRVRLGDAYEPTQHLGGAVYVFLRGIDGPERGSYVMPPVWPLLDALDDLLSMEEEQA